MKTNQLTIYIVHHTNSGTPEANQIHGVFQTMELAEAAMEQELADSYDSDLEDNEYSDLMYITEHELVKDLSAANC